MREKRNSDDGQPVQSELELGTIPNTTRTPGGSAEARHHPGVGGGSRDIYKGSKAPVARRRAPPPRPAVVADPRLADLRAIGLNRTLLAVAERIGFDAFVPAWEVMSSSPQVQENGYRLMVPAFSTFLRFQRNLLIRQLAAEHMKPPRIAHEVFVRTGEKITVTQIQRILQAS